MSKNIVIIPTFNEIENIKNIINSIFDLSIKFDILVVDDNSPDGTGKVVKELMNIYPDRLFILERPKKEGLGRAYISGFKWSLEKNYDYILEMDADFSHNPKDLVLLIETCLNENVDLAIGSRYIQGINVINWPLGRVLMSYFGSKYVRFITGLKIHDTTSGFKCFNSKVLKSINLDNVKFKGYAFQIEMHFRVWKLGYKIKEVSIVFTDRQQGKSKMSTSIFKEAIIGVIKLKLMSLFNLLK